jgi:hypothetical protein
MTDAAPVPAAPEAPATPVAPSTPIANRPPATTSVTRMFDGRRQAIVRPAPHTISATVSSAAVGSGAGATPSTVPAGASAAPSPATPLAGNQGQSSGPELGGLTGEAPSGAPNTPPAEAPPTPAAVEPKPAETISAAEEAKRIARITRASQKLAEEKRTLAEERKQHAVNLERVKQLETARDYALQDPAEFVARLYGADARVLRQRIVERTIQNNARPPQQQAQELVEERTSGLTARLQEYERELKALQAKQVTAEQEQQITRYVEASVMPVLGDASKYELTLRALGGAEAAAKEVFALQRKRYEATKQTLTPSQAADEIEGYLRGQRDVLNGQSGTSAKPAVAPTQSSPKAEPPPATANGSPARNPHSSMAYRNLPKPYTTKVVKP